MMMLRTGIVVTEYDLRDCLTSCLARISRPHDTLNIWILFCKVHIDRATGQDDKRNGFALGRLRNGLDEAFLVPR